MNKKIVGRIRRATKVRAQIRNLEAASLTVFRSNQHIYVQLLSEDGSRTLAQASTLDKEFKALGIPTSNVKAAEAVGTLIAKRALAQGKTKVAFDRSGYRYHGRVKALADAARASGLEF